MSTSLPRSALLLVVAFAIYSLLIVPTYNGFFPALMSLKEPGATLPGFPPVPVHLNYTGIRFLDETIAPMIGFFWPAFDGTRADVSLLAFVLIGQFTAAWILIAVETWRVGQKQGWAILAATILGLFLQFVGYAIIPPLWMFFHLLLSPTVKPASSAPMTLSDPLPLFTIPLSILVAVLIPNVLILLTSAVNAAPSTFEKDGSLPPLTSANGDIAAHAPSAKQFYTALSQFWSVIFGAAQILLPSGFATVESQFIIYTEPDKKILSRKYSIWCYRVAIMIGTVTHLAYVALPILARFFPPLLDPTYRSQLQPSNVFIPPPVHFPPSTAKPLDSVADGVLGFMQWDLILGSAALLIWTTALRVQAQAAIGKGLWLYEWAAKVVRTIVLVVCCGPSAAAAEIMLRRDNLIFERNKKTR